MSGPERCGQASAMTALAIAILVIGAIVGWAVTR